MTTARSSPSAAHSSVWWTGYSGGASPLQGRQPLAFSTPDADWWAINGRVDTNGDGVIDENDCTLNVAGTIDVVAVDPITGITCEGLVTGMAAADHGKVDVDGDRDITSADDCAACFFG